MPQSPRRTIARWAAAAICCMAVAYPLSYAPVVRWESERLNAELYRNGVSFFGTIDGADLPAYKPIDWLIDNTPLDAPLFAWARVWGVAFEFETGSLIRQNGNHAPLIMIDPPPITKQPSTESKSAATDRLPPDD
jgi:hypothetical protein